MLRYVCRHRYQDHERSAGTARIALFYLVLVEPLAFRLLPYGRSVMRPSICEAFADNAFDRIFGALYVVNSTTNAIVIPKVEFSQVAVQVLFAAMLIDALHSALENRVVAFDRVGVDGFDVELGKRIVLGEFGEKGVGRLLQASVDLLQARA